MKENKFYVYAHYRASGYKEDEIFYVGKGSGNRSKGSSGRNSYWKHIVNKYGYYVEILYDNLSEEMAFQLEVLTIARYGRKDLGLGPLVNTSDGGEGFSGVVRTSEHNKKIAESLKGTVFTKSRCVNISKSLKGKKQTKEHILAATKGREGSVAGCKNPNYNKLGKDNPLSKFIVANRFDTNEVIQEFSGFNEASRITGLDFSNISKCCRGKISFSGLYNSTTGEWIKMPRNKQIPTGFVKIVWNYIEKQLTN